MNVDDFGINRQDDDDDDDDDDNVHTVQAKLAERPPKVMKRSER